MSWLHSVQSFRLRSRPPVLNVWSPGPVLGSPTLIFLWLDFSCLGPGETWHTAVFTGGAPLTPEALSAVWNGLRSSFRAFNAKLVMTAAFFFSGWLHNIGFLIYDTGITWRPPRKLSIKAFSCLGCEIHPFFGGGWDQRGNVIPPSGREILLRIYLPMPGNDSRK